MDLNRQALLVMALAVLGPAAAAHAAAPGRLTSTIHHHRVLPGTSSGRRGSSAYAGLLIVVEMAVVGVGGVALLGGAGTRLAGVLLAASGLAFLAYVATLLIRGYQGDCGCSPLTASITGLSLLPGASLVLAGALLAPDRAYDDVAFAASGGAVETGLALVTAGLLGALVSLLPASALVGDPQLLSGEE